MLCEQMPSEALNYRMPLLPHSFEWFPSQVAMKHPSAVTACNLDLENLITDSNRSIATLAITTLLKTGSESSVDRLMKQISSFVSEISDEFKVWHWRPLLFPAAGFLPFLFLLSFSHLLTLQ